MDHVIGPLGPLRESEEEPEGEVSLVFLQEASGIVATRSGGVVDDRGVVKLAVIRPCVSRGKRLGGLPPIYTPAMLAENAGLFTGWPMFMDHMIAESLAEGEEPFDLHQALAETARRRQRSVTELGGRIVRSWWDPTFRTKQDDDLGFRPGAVLAEAIPQEVPAKMIARDPEILRVSINAWPTGARPSTAPWDASKRGMLIEGLAENPPGSVDWVIRAGAGGHVLAEDARFALSVAESVYLAPHEREDAPVRDIEKMSSGDIVAYLKEHAPSVLQEAAAAPAAPALPENVVTVETLESVLEAQEERLMGQFRSALQESEPDVEARVQEALEERDEIRRLASVAHEMIREAELPDVWKTELRSRYAILPSGPTPALLVQESEEDPDAIIRARVTADVEHCGRLTEELAPDPAPRNPGGSPRKQGADTNVFVDFLREDGAYENEEDAVKAIREAASL